MSRTTQPQGDPGAFNVQAWAVGDYAADYAGRDLAPVEAVQLARWSAALDGAVLELGCGAGRLTRVLAQLSGGVRAIDVSPGMVEACRRAVPGAAVQVGDLRDLGAFSDGSLGAVVGANNVLDVLGDQDRRGVLEEIARVLAPAGLLLFSSHNRAFIPFIADGVGPERVALRSPVGVARAVWHARRLPGLRRNRRRARAFERVESDYAIVNDEAHDYRLAHYYITREAQERQLVAAGLSLLECRDNDALVVPPGAEAARSSALHYVARRTG